MQFHLICDSTSLYSRDQAAQFDLLIVPLKVIFGDTEYTEGVDLTVDDYYDKFDHSSELPRTSQPTPAAFIEAFSTYDDDLPIICTTIAEGLSGTFSSAQQAASELPKKIIHLLDTKSTGPGHRMIVETLIALRDADVTAEEALIAIQPQVDHMFVMVTVPTLEHLRRGGRIGAAQALLGSLLNIRPLIALDQGAVIPVDRIRTFSRVLDRMVQDVDVAKQKLGSINIFIAHANSMDVAQNLAERCNAYSNAQIKIMDIGPVLASHTGPGTVGLCYAPVVHVPKKVVAGVKK